MSRGWPRHLGPGWLAAYALGICWLGNKFDSGQFPPPEDRP